jgi:tRNA(Arg) A34 adenosine deaminase TadA
MCLEACKRAGIKRIYYGASPQNVVYPVNEYVIEMYGGILLDDCLGITSHKYKPL